MEFAQAVNANDVISGRRIDANLHSGDMIFRYLIKDSIQAHSRLFIKEKRDIMEKVIGKII